MNFKEYIEFTTTTVKYDISKDYEYAYAGLISELGELVGAYAKFIRGDYDEQELRVRMKKELGDCIWMFARLIYASGNSDIISYSNFLLETNNEIEIKIKEGYSKGVVSECTVPLILDTIYCTDSVFSVYDPTSPDINVDDVYDFCQNVAGLLVMLDSSIEEIVSINVSKLSERLKNNKIKGDGEQR